MRYALLIATLSLSCSHSRSAELTAAEHRAEAEVHLRNARKEAAEYDATQTTRFPGRDPYVASPSDWTSTYNPTGEHLAAADAEMRKAAEHVAAARRLEAFENAACRDIAPEERSACPLLASAVTAVHETKFGVELALKPGVDGADTHRRLDCHLAYAEANGFDRPSCPLFVRGMSIRLRDSTVLVLSGTTLDVAKALQEQARRIFAPPAMVRPPVAVSVRP
jgi:hypothetical protein